MPKAKTRKTSKKTIRSRNLWRTAQGGIRFKHISVVVFVVGIASLATAATLVKRPLFFVGTPLGSLSHTSVVPDTGELLARVNVARSQAQQTPVSQDDTLRMVAETRLKDMINTQIYGHKDSSGKYFYDLLREKEYGSVYSCENLDIESTTLPQQFIDRWLKSTTGHRKCLLHENVSKIGVASGEFTTDDRGNKSYLVVVILSQPQ